MGIAAKTLLLGLLLAAPATAAPLATSTCNSEPLAPACHAVRGDRTEGWRAQTRSEVMARNGLVRDQQIALGGAGGPGHPAPRWQCDRRRGRHRRRKMLNLTEPMNVGMGGDLFAIIYTAKDHKLHVLNASGMAASGATIAFMNAKGYRADPMNWGPGSGMPKAGILTATVPGAVWGWQEVIEKYGSMTFKQVLEPAASYASEGVPLTERAANDWRLPKAIGPSPSDAANCCTTIDPDSIHTWYIDGRPPHAGQIFRNPDLAKAFRLLQAQGRDAFYKGDIARAIVAKEKALGGTMTMADLAAYKGEWGEPVTETIPASPWPSCRRQPGHAANEMLGILSACVGRVLSGTGLAGPTDPRYWHMLVEAKLAYADLIATNGSQVSIPAWAIK